MPINLESIAGSNVAEWFAYNADGRMDEASDQWLDDIRDETHEWADNVVIYSAQAEAVLDRYAHQVDGVDDLCGEQEFAAADWEQARDKYAFCVAWRFFEDHAALLCGKVADAVEDLLDQAEQLGCPEDQCHHSIITAATSCPHGWAAHDHESDLTSGVLHVWKRGQLDGLNGVSIKVEMMDLWINLTWA